MPHTDQRAVFSSSPPTQSTTPSHSHVKGMGRTIGSSNISRRWHFISLVTPSHSASSAPVLHCGIPSQIWCLWTEQSLSILRDKTGKNYPFFLLSKASKFVKNLNNKLVSCKNLQLDLYWPRTQLILALITVLLLIAHPLSTDLGPGYALHCALYHIPRRAQRCSKKWVVIIIQNQVLVNEQ